MSRGEIAQPVMCHISCSQPAHGSPAPIRPRLSLPDDAQALELSARNGSVALSMPAPTKSAVECGSRNRSPRAARARHGLESDIPDSSNCPREASARL